LINGTVREQVVARLRCREVPGATCESERWRLDAVLDRVEAKLAELNALRERIVAARNACANGHCMFAGDSASARERRGQPVE
jgi:hypothetical protein